MSQPRSSRPAIATRGVPFSIRLTAEMRAFLEAQAAKEHRPMSNLIEKILEDYREARAADEKASWEDFWTGVHTTARQHGLDRLKEGGIVGEVRAVRRQRARQRRRA